MDRVRYFYRTGTAHLIGILIALLFSGCVLDSQDDCPPDRELIYIRVSDVLTGEDITGIEKVSNTTLYFFDKNKNFVNSFQISPDQIQSYIPIDVTGMNMDGGYVSVWGNVGDLVSVTEATTNMYIDSLSVSLISNADYMDFYDYPDDLFFGYQQLNFSTFQTCCETVKQETVNIMRKNAKLHLTVRGLRDIENFENYYFKIVTGESGYNFSGIPISSPRDFRGVGIIDSTNTYVTQEPYMMLHTGSMDDVNDDNCIDIYLFQMSTDRADIAQDTQIISANRDINGNYISLESGKTTNVLMEITGIGDVQVSVVITDWEEIYQWEIW